MRRRQDDGMSDAPHMPTIEYVSHSISTTTLWINPNWCNFLRSYMAPRDLQDPWVRQDTPAVRENAAWTVARGIR